MTHSTPNGEAHSEHVVKADLFYCKLSDTGEVPTHPKLLAKDPNFIDVGTVDIRDVRQAKQEFSIDTAGFQFGRMPLPSDVDFTDSDSVKEKYLPALEEFVAQLLGASSVKAYSHKIRTRTYEQGDFQSVNYDGPVILPHVDITPSFAPNLFGWVQPEVYSTVLKENKRWAMFNVWRPLKPVQRDPLAVADKTSVPLEDHISVVTAQPNITTFFTKNNKNHRWWYMKDQTPEDVLVFLQHDSQGGPVVPHAAFSLPEAPPSEPRQSIEARVIAVW